jgi:hypothetical protein
MFGDNRRTVDRPVDRLILGKRWVRYRVTNDAADIKD